MADRGSSKADHILEVDGEGGGLLEAQSPLVLNNVGESLLQNVSN